MFPEVASSTETSAKIIIKAVIVRNEKGQFIPGVSGNPYGKPLGTENFHTIWWKFIEKVAKANEITPEEVDEQLLQVAFKQMKAGDFRYWKDVRDRIHGMAKLPIEHSGGITIEQLLDSLEYEQQTGGQKLADKSFIQNQGQAGQSDSVPKE